MIPFLKVVSQVITHLLKEVQNEPDSPSMVCDRLDTIHSHLFLADASKTYIS
jgi:hypothetical protein